MTLFVSFGFYGLATVFLLIERLVRLVKVEARPWVLLGLNALALKQFKVLDWKEIGLLSIALSCAYFGIRLGRRVNLFCYRVVLFGAFGVFVLWRLPRIGGWLELVGLSYIFVKLLHFWIDSQKGRIAAVKWHEFLNYFLFFPTYTAGPIVRFQEFQNDLQAPATVTEDDAIAAIDRIAIGLAKKLLLVPMLGSLALTSQSSAVLRFREYPLALVAYSLLIFLISLAIPTSPLAWPVCLVFAYPKISAARTGNVI